ncbi:hypothetical protein PG984_002978 [Apiospora sp. TS-2023a]
MPPGFGAISQLRIFSEDLRLGSRVEMLRLTIVGGERVGRRELGATVLAHDADRAALDLVAGGSVLHGIATTAAGAGAGAGAGARTK